MDFDQRERRPSGRLNPETGGRPLHIRGLEIGIDLLGAAGRSPGGLRLIRALTTERGPIDSPCIFDYDSLGAARERPDKRKGSALGFSRAIGEADGYRMEDDDVRVSLYSFARMGPLDFRPRYSWRTDGWDSFDWGI
ncbi:hypothetical protein KM043_012091 [Ampulex compressa]|nr:hypothetical protein KM043_012091 [Ampulex compressa]